MHNQIPIDESYLEGLDSIEAETGAVSEQERQDIERQLEAMMTASRQTKPMSTGPTRRDTGLPLAVGLGTALAVLAAVFFGARSYKTTMDRLMLDPYGFTASEGRVLQQYRLESEQVIKEKDAEILTILSRLETLEMQRSELEALSRTALAEQQRIVEQRVEAALGAERRKLETEGAELREAETRLQELEAQLLREASEQMRQLAEQNEAALASRRAELLAEQQQARDELAQVSRERSSLLVERGLGASDAESAQAAIQIVESQERDLAVQREISGLFREALEAVGRGGLEEAEGTLAEIRRRLQDPSLDRLPSMSLRRDADRELVSLLQEHIRLRRQPEASTQPPRDPAAASPSALVSEPTPSESAPEAPAVDRPETADSPPAAEPRAASGSRAVGRVTLVADRGLLVETLAGFSLSIGDSVEIRRRSNGVSIRLATAVVEEVSGTRVRCRLSSEPLLDPAALDPVYLIGR